jgi:hypothetical protein
MVSVRWRRWAAGLGPDLVLRGDEPVDREARQSTTRSSASTAAPDAKSSAAIMRQNSRTIFSDLFT